MIDDDGLVEATGQLSYDDHGLTAERDGDPPDRREEPFTVDASSVEIEFDHDGSTLTFRAVADDEEAARVEVSDADWDLRDS